MQLGAFSISLSVKDLMASKSFYEALGFDTMGGDPDHGYLIMKNNDTLVGLFQDMFEGNLLTFNPGWDQNAQAVDPFDDVRHIKARLAEAGIDIQQEQGGATGPASFVVIDPDGNPILIDQHR